MLKDITKLAGKYLLDNFAESFVDNVIKKRVQPAIGSVVYCELVFSATAHSGIYIGDGDIVHLDGSGEIERVTAKQFLNRLDGFNSAISIYVSCQDETPIGLQEIASRAEDMVAEQLEYNLLLNNCHKFTTGCITGEFNNSTVTFNDLEQVAQESMQVNNWLVWDLKEE